MSDELTMVLRVLLAVVLGAIVGLQRERANKPAGIRTNVLIATGAALFTIISVFAFEGDSARVTAGIVTGIGFLGAGSIMRRGEGVVEGLTTAATIWAVAGVGMAAGAGLYLIATVTTFLIVGVLIIPKNFLETEREDKEKEEDQESVS